VTPETGRWSRWIIHRRHFVIGAWLALGTALLPLAGRVEEELEVVSRIPGSPSAEVEEILATRFESPFAHSLLVVAGGVPAPDTPKGREALKDVVAALAGVPGVTRTLSYLDSADGLFLPTIGAQGTFVLVGLDPARVPEAGLIPRLRASTEPVARSLRRRFPGATVRWTGEAALNFDLRRATTDEVGAGERRAAPVTLVLLLLAFGAMVAALLPIASGALAIVLSLGVATLITRVWPLAVSLQSVVSMLGLGLGIDYALLTLSRFREARQGGLSAHEAAVQAAHHAGRTVALSGTAVAVGFLGLLLVPLSELRSVAVGGLLAVTASVLIATTLLPALLACLGARVDAGRLLPARAGVGGRGWQCWGAWVAAHPGWVLLIAGGPVIALAAQAGRLRAELPRGDWLPAMESASALRDLRAMGRGGMAQGMRVILELPEDISAIGPAGWTATRRLADTLGADERVARVLWLRTAAGERGDDLAYVALLPSFLNHTFVSGEGDAALLEIIPRGDVEPSELSRLVRELRRKDASALAGVRGARLRVGGLPGFNADYEDAAAGRSWMVVLLVVAGTFVALMVSFRSVLVPVKAIALNLLSVGAAFGAVVLVFQEGHGASWAGLAGPTGGVFPAVPLLVFAIVFGLSMDYEVFLLARIAEARRAGLPEAAAVAAGLGRTGGVITSAAAIMVAVFGAFALGDLLVVRILGFALAVAVLLDATLIRIAIGPALLCLAGRWNWWPGRLDVPPVPTDVPLAQQG
jgi:putative drug exporter of the RND superfamily